MKRYSGGFALCLIIAISDYLRPCDRLPQAFAGPPLYQAEEGDLTIALADAEGSARIRRLRLLQRPAAG